MPTRPLHRCEDWTKMPNHDGENTEWSSSQQLPWFSCCFFVSLWGLTEFPSLRQSCRDSPARQGKSKPSVTKVNGFGPDMGQWMWARASHADRYTHRHTPVPFAIMWNLERMQSRLTIYLGNSTPWITDEVLWMCATMRNDCWWNNGTMTGKASIYNIIKR